NKKLDFEHVRTKIANNSFENRKTIYKNNNEDQIYEIIELLSDENYAFEIIELLNNNDKNQKPKIIKLLSDEEVMFEENQRIISRDQISEIVKEIIEIT
ncbi:9852_t:CDS:1, partial [Scutellospora calospora]